MEEVRTAVQEEPKNENKQDKPKKIKTERNVLKKIMLVLLALILLAASAYAGYYYRDMQTDEEIADKNTQINVLNQEKSDLQKQVDEAAAADDSADTAAAEKTAPSADDLGNIEDSITSGNTAALEGYMASKVNVILAASECCGSRTPAQAVADIAYVESGTDPWDFSLPQATLDSYAAGDYAQYFPEDALVGVSANDYIISFTFNDAGDISGVFMANSTEIL